MISVRIATQNSSFPDVVQIPKSIWENVHSRSLPLYAIAIEQIDIDTYRVFDQASYTGESDKKHWFCAIPSEVKEGTGFFRPMNFKNLFFQKEAILAASLDESVTPNQRVSALTLIAKGFYQSSDAEDRAFGISLVKNLTNELCETPLDADAATRALLEAFDEARGSPLLC